MKKPKHKKHFRVTKKALSVKVDGIAIGLMTHRELCHTVYSLTRKIERIERLALQLAAGIL